MYEILLSGLVGALLGVILGSVLSFYFQILLHNHKLNDRRKFVATVFMNEIEEIKSFCDQLHSKKIDGITIQKYNQNNNSFSLDYSQVGDLLIIMNENPYFSIKDNERLKKSFEIFNNEIYSFEDPALIRDLISLGKMVYDAENFLEKYFQTINNERPNSGISENYLNLVWFISSVQNISGKIDKILTDKTLEKNASMDIKWKLPLTKS